mmetsp:Transcript_105877/g.330135  ORF Transcript_105877/g.330135 Transcript_105877/m.330135 type:complete len:263 (-) Transcript_105877:859-1647(-)
MPASSALMSSPSFEDCASKSALWSCVLAVVISFSWSSDLQKSTFFTSSCCCTFSMAISLSMAFFTVVNASSSTDVASAMRPAPPPPDRRAAFRRSPAACWRRPRARPPLDEPLDEERCAKLKLPFMASRASSSVRISMVSDTALISASRALLRAANFSPASAQVASKFARNFWDSVRAACSCIRSSFASACALVDAARSSSARSATFSPLSICATLASRRSAKDAPRLRSNPWDSDRLASISSLSCFRTPRISPLCEKYAGL